MSSDKKKLLSNNMETDDREINSKLELEKTRQSCSTDEESIPKVPSKMIPRQSSEHYIATLPFSEFSTHGLQVYPVPSPSPSPEPIIHRPPPPSSSRSAPATNPASTADAPRPGPSKSLLDNGQTAAEGMELRIYNELHQFLKAKKQGDKVQQSPPSVSKDSVPVVQGETLQVGHRPENDSPNGLQQSQKGMQSKKQPRCEMPEETRVTQKPQVSQEERLEQPPKREIEDSLSVDQEQTLQVRRQSKIDSSNGLQDSQKDYMENEKRPGCEMTEATQPQEEQLKRRPKRKIEDSVPVVQGETLQVSNGPENNSPNGKQQSQKDDIQNKKRPGCKMTEATRPSATQVSQEQLEQLPRRMSSRKIQSPEKKP